MQVCALFRLRHVAPLTLCGCSCASAPFRQRVFLVISPRRLPSRFAPAAFPRWLLGFPPCRPPCNPPAKPPFRATKRLILWGGLFRGKTHFRGGNLALLSPLRGGHGSIARLAAWRVRQKRHPQEKERRKGKQDNQPLQGALCACSGTKNSLIQRRVKGAKHREAARP